MRSDALIKLIVGFATAYSTSPAASSEFKILHTFSPGTTAGWLPSGELTMASDGALYGTTLAGGATCPTTMYSCGGTVYRLAAPTQSGGAWQYSVLYSFKGNKDGAAPMGGVILQASTGILFGTTQYGGVPSCSAEPHGWGCGTAFELAPPATSGARWGQSTIVSFPGGDQGAFPAPRWLQFANGSLFGNTTGGGPSHAGTIVLLSPKKTSAASSPNPIEFIVQYVYKFFSSSNQGSNPFGFFEPSTQNAPLPNQLGGGIGNEGADAMITQGDGDDNCRCGALTVPYRPDPKNPNWSTKDLLQFHGGALGAIPLYGIVGPGGVLYGTARGGINCPAVTSNGCGIVFRFTPATGTQKAVYEVLYRFRGGTDGALPIGRLQVDKSGHVFGVTQLGGNGCTSDRRGCGTLYELIPPVPPATSWTEKIQHNFSVGPSGGLLSVKGVYYGLDDSHVFSFAP